MCTTQIGMAELSGDVGGVSPAMDTPELSGYGNGAAPVVTPTPPPPLTVSGSFKEGKSSSRRRGHMRPSMDSDEFINLLHGSDPVKVELNRLENEVRGANAVRSSGFCEDLELVLLDFECFDLFLLVYSYGFFADKDRELGEAQAEIKALRLSERLREKAVEEVISLLLLLGSFLFSVMYFGLIQYFSLDIRQLCIYYAIESLILFYFFSLFLGWSSNSCI